MMSNLCVRAVDTILHEIRPSLRRDPSRARMAEGGERLFEADATAGALRLVASRTSASGVGTSTYVPAGPSSSPDGLGAGIKRCCQPATSRGACRMPSRVRCAGLSPPLAASGKPESRRRVPD